MYDFSEPGPMKADTEGADTESLQLSYFARRAENTSLTPSLTPRNKTITTETGKQPQELTVKSVENANSTLSLQREVVRS